jgi:hypothetical protein
LRGFGETYFNVNWRLRSVARPIALVDATSDYGGGRERLGAPTSEN